MDDEAEDGDVLYLLGSTKAIRQAALEDEKDEDPYLNIPTRSAAALQRDGELNLARLRPRLTRQEKQKQINRVSWM